MNKIINADVLEGLRSLPGGIADMCVTSPPYYNLRDYGCEGQIGLETTPEEYIEKLVSVFLEVCRVIKEDGTLWINIGDSYNGSGKGGDPRQKYFTRHKQFGKTQKIETVGRPVRLKNLKPKDLIGIPWMLAFALRDAGLYLRQDIIWAKPSCLPEFVTDRCVKSHEYIFLLSKNKDYYFDYEAIREPAVSFDGRRNTFFRGSKKYAKSGRTDSYIVNGGKRWPNKLRGLKENESSGVLGQEQFHGDDIATMPARNKRDVWTVPFKFFAGDHYAVYPPNLIRPCIRAGSRPGGIVLDPFFGSGTTGIVAIEEGRQFIGIELNPEYCDLAQLRINHALKIPGKEDKVGLLQDLDFDGN